MVEREGFESLETRRIGIRKGKYGWSGEEGGAFRYSFIKRETRVMARDTASIKR